MCQFVITDWYFRGRENRFCNRNLSKVICQRALRPRRWAYFAQKIASLGRIDALGNTLKEVKERPCNLLIANTMVKTKSIYDHLFSNLILDEGYVFVKIDSQTLIIYFISSISKVHFID